MKFIDKVMIIVLLIAAIIEWLVYGKAEMATLYCIFINQIIIMTKIDRIGEK